MNIENLFHWPAFSTISNITFSTILNLSQLLYCSQKMLLLIKMILNDYGHFVTYGTKCQNGKGWFFKLKFRALVVLSWKMKSYYSLLLFTVTVHFYYSLRFFCLLKGDVPYVKTQIFLTEFSIGEFSWENSLGLSSRISSTTSLQIL